VVAGVGRVLIAVGLLMFGFVAYQLWGTGIEYRQSQDRLADEFTTLVAGTPSAPTTPTDTTSPPTAPAPSPTTAPPTTAAPATSAAPVPDFSSGDVMALLEIPSIGVHSYVVSGVEPADLKHGPGHYPDTPMPGQLGNSAIAGHRTTYGQPFYRLDEVAPGDEILVTTVQGRFVYRATGSEVVGAGSSDVVATTDPTVARLTLTTCTPRYTAAKRLIVFADLDVAASAAPQAPIIQEPGVTRSTLPGSDTVPVPTTGGATSSVPSSSAATTVAPATSSTASPASPASPAGTAGSPSADAFSHGWFSDDGAWPQVALWGLVVSAISIGAWLLSRRVRNNWVGGLVGIVPFLVALYFLFQNVNRLLPAAL
jgi:sortase A